MNLHVQVKICGITNREDLNAAVSLGADAIGFVTGVTSSPRSIPDSKVYELVRRSKTGKNVIVMVPRDTDEVEYMYNRVEPDLIQVHGDSIIKELLVDLPDLPLIIGVNTGYDRDSIMQLSKKYAILVDSKVSGVYGGTGVTHNWGKSRQMRDMIHPGRLILAGGLTSDNVSQAIRTVDPYCVDVSSGVEAKPGVKDHAKMRGFIAAVRKVGEEMISE